MNRVKYQYLNVKMTDLNSTLLLQFDIEYYLLHYMKLNYYYIELGWGKSNFRFFSCFSKRIYSYKFQGLINDICAALIDDLLPLFW